jgi:hypothetical protein
MAEKKAKVDSGFLSLLPDAYNNSVYSGSFTRWSSKMKSVIAIDGWNDEISMNILLMKITGDAEDYYYDKKDLDGFKEYDWMSSFQSVFTTKSRRKSKDIL